MIESEWGDTVYTVICDECGEDAIFDCNTWGDLMSTLKEDGWKTTKEDGEWLHYCEVCR